MQPPTSRMDTGVRNPARPLPSSLVGTAPKPEGHRPEKPLLGSQTPTGTGRETGVSGQVIGGGGEPENMCPPPQEARLPLYSS